MIKFITTTDIIDLGDVMIRPGAVGVWDTAMLLVIFRKRDVIGEKDGISVDEAELFGHFKKLDIEETVL
jgi:hypothetical protein